MQLSMLYTATGSVYEHPSGRLQSLDWNGLTGLVSWTGEL